MFGMYHLRFFKRRPETEKSNIKVQIAELQIFFNFDFCTMLFALCFMHRFSHYLARRIEFVSLFWIVSAFAETSIFIEKYLIFVSFFCIISAFAETDNLSEIYDERI